MKDVLLVSGASGETKRRLYTPGNESTCKCSKVLAKKRLTTSGLLHTYSMTLPKCIKESYMMILTLLSISYMF